MATKYLGSNSLLYLLTLIKTKLDAKVDKETGKGLSTNDYTTAEKTKLAGIETGANKYTLPTAAKNTLGGVKTTSDVTSATGYTATPIISGVPYYKDTTYSAATTSANGLMSAADKTKLDGIDTGAEVNVIETVKVNGTAQAITSKAVDITVPTKTGDLTNNSGFITASGAPVQKVNGQTGEVLTTTYVNVTETTQGSVKVLSADKTFDDLIDLYHSGETIFAKYVISGAVSDTAVLPCVVVPVDASTDTYFKFAGIVAIYDTEGNMDEHFVQLKCDTNGNPEWSLEVNEEIPDFDYMQSYVGDKFNTVEAEIPTKVSQLTNDSSYATETYVQEAIGDIAGITYSVVSTLPTTGEAGVIYLVPKTAETKDIYIEYIWVNNAFEMIGTTAPDLSGYVKTSDLVELTNTEVQSIWDEA